VNRRPLFVLALAAALAAGWLGARLYVAWAQHGMASSRHAPADEALTAAGTAGTFEPSGVAAEPDGMPDPEMLPPVHIPASLPQFTLADAAGKPTPISAWHGKSLVLNFWATWCAPCRREIPLLEAVAAQWSGRDVAVVGVAVDHRAEVVAFAQQYHIGYPLLVGEQDALDAAAALGVASPVFPFTVFTDRQERIVAVFVGELHRAQADLILSVVARLNDGQNDLGAARRAIADGLEEIKARRP
jgi:thiol-disulfide isomerase/thioredoxin